VYPGALTPTEILSAHRSGASAVKLFPASAVSPGYLKDVRGPFPGIPVIPTGGIHLDDIPAWFAAGAAAVGLGSPLLGSSLADGPDAALADRARRAMTAVAAARQQS
jgi:2-dehydro-3-deoxyphosphogluconate aldolase/(4S)-4-hydroxy-2-oxoglutarate aldolase